VNCAKQSTFKAEGLLLLREQNQTNVVPNQKEAKKGQN